MVIMHVGLGRFLAIFAATAEVMNCQLLVQILDICISLEIKMPVLAIIIIVMILVIKY